MHPEVSVAFVTLGCPKNEVDTDRMRALVTASAYRVVEDVTMADVVVVNTCSFIQDATEESIAAVLSLVEHDADLRPDRRIIVAGCMVSRYSDDLAEAMPDVAAFVPVGDEGALLGSIERITGVPALARDVAVARTVSGPSAYLQVSDGCHRSCSYCTIPFIRGPYRSRPLPDIIAEARELVSRGVLELVLIGQDVTAYGRDLDEEISLSDVISALGAVEGLRWLRVMYAQPEGVTDDLIEAMASSPVVCRYLDMPLQHASREVLRRMNRAGDAESLLRLIGRIRAALPDVVLRTTVIAGFPGETRDDVRTLTRFLTEARFDYVGVFPYSQEDGTPAATLPDQVPLRTRRARAQRLRDLAHDSGVERVSGLVGSELEVLVEGVDPDDGVVFGRWRGQAPEIDGVVLLDGGEVGEIRTVRIVDSLGYDLEGEVT